MEGGCESLCVGEGGLLGVSEGKWPEVAKIGVGGAPGPGVNGRSNGVGAWGALRCGTKGLPEKGKVVRRDNGEGGRGQ